MKLVTIQLEVSEELLADLQARARNWGHRDQTSIENLIDAVLLAAVRDTRTARLISRREGKPNEWVT